MFLYPIDRTKHEDYDIHMAYSLEIKNKAIELRKAGYSIKEIARTLTIAVSTSSIWLRKTPISSAGKNRMQKQSSINRYKMSIFWNKKRLKRLLFHQKKAQKILKQVIFTKSINKLICAVLFWAEGSKNTNHIAFTNSDPRMIEVFLNLLRQSYDLDESKFHVSMHLHEYHDLQRSFNFWSKVTKINRLQFIKPYIKPHTGFRKKLGYKGCITIRYYDSEIARELTALYNSLPSK